MSLLRFSTLRFANSLRLPQFKNKHGGLAHSKPDGSDWSPAQWFQAMVGEVGEYARIRTQYEDGQMPFEEYKVKAGKELADIQTYLDILARRALDEVMPSDFDSPAQLLQRLMAPLGEYANVRKKLDRGDYTVEEYQKESDPLLDQTQMMLSDLVESENTERFNSSDRVATAHSDGIDLGLEVMLKFNEVSHRVGSDVFIDGLGNVVNP